MGTIKGKDNEDEKLRKRKIWDLTRGLALVNVILSDAYRQELKPMLVSGKFTENFSFTGKADDFITDSDFEFLSEVLEQNLSNLLACIKKNGSFKISSTTKTMLENYKKIAEALIHPTSEDSVDSTKKSSGAQDVDKLLLGLPDSTELIKHLRSDIKIAATVPPPLPPPPLPPWPAHLSKNSPVEAPDNKPKL